MRGISDLLYRVVPDAANTFFFVCGSLLVVSRLFRLSCFDFRVVCCGVRKKQVLFRFRPKNHRFVFLYYRKHEDLEIHLLAC